MNQSNGRFGFGEKRTNSLVETLAAHPYLIALFVCLVTNVLCLGSQDNIPSTALMAEILAVLAAGFALIHALNRRLRFKPWQKGIVSVAFVTVTVAAAIKYSHVYAKSVWLLAGGTVVTAVIYALADTKRYKTQLNAWLIMTVGFLLKFYYILDTSIYMRQNDVHVFGESSGHAGYIEYILYNHKLPDFDVREVWQYCHPPLHHIICAIWIWLSESVFSVGYNAARESLQTLSLFYSTAIVITAYKILRHFRLSGKALYFPLALISFHPAFILFSGSINNDPLSVLFMLGAVLCTLKWYEKQSLGGILKIALCIGLGMMTKLSAALVAPPVAIVFLIVFIKKIRTNALGLIKQYLAFALVCVPLGLWFEIKNYVKYRVPITYVQEMSDKVLQYIGDRSFTSRITDFSKEQFSSVFEQWAWIDDGGNICGYNEYNPLIAMLKNSLFGESINSGYFGDVPSLLIVCRMFFWTTAILAAISLIVMLVTLFGKCTADRVHKLFFIAFYVCLVGNFYKMSAQYPFTCTMNFRYITPTVIINALFMGLFMSREEKSTGVSATVISAVSKLLMALTAIFCLLSYIVYIVVCYPVEQ